MSTLRCAGCGRAGETPKIRWSNAAEPTVPVLHPRFGWHADGRPALLCPDCEKILDRETGRRSRTKRGTATATSTTW